MGKVLKQRKAKKERNARQPLCKQIVEDELKNEGALSVKSLQKQEKAQNDVDADLEAEENERLSAKMTDRILKFAKQQQDELEQENEAENGAKTKSGVTNTPATPKDTQLDMNFAIDGYDYEEIVQEEGEYEDVVSYL